MITATTNTFANVGADVHNSVGGVIAELVSQNTRSSPRAVLSHLLVTPHLLLSLEFEGALVSYDVLAPPDSLLAGRQYGDLGCSGFMVVQFDVRG